MAARVPDSVAEALRARLRNDPADADAFRQLKAHYRARGDLGSLFNLLKGWAGFTRDPHERAEALREAAALAAEGGDPQRAIDLYRELLQLDPMDLDASEALQGLWEQLGDLTTLTEFLQAHVQVLEERGAPRAEVALLRYRLGELWGKQFDSPDEALHHYRKAFELDPGLLRAAYEARQLCLQAGRLREAAELNEQEAAAEPDPERAAALLCELAELYGEELGDLDGAVSAMERACHAQPDAPDLLDELVQWLSRRGETLEPAAAAADRGRIANALCRLAELLPPEEGIAYLESALEHDPSHAAAMAGLEQRLGGTARELELAGHWVQFVAAAPEGTALHQRRVLLARAYADQGQVDDALFCLQPAVEQGIPDALLLAQTLRGTADEHGSSPHSEVTDGQDVSGQFEALRASEESRARHRLRPSDAPDDDLDEALELQPEDLDEAPDEDGGHGRSDHTVMTSRSDLEQLRQASDPQSGVHEDVTVISASPLDAWLSDAQAQYKPPKPTREIGADALAAARAASLAPPPPPTAEVPEAHEDGHEDEQGQGQGQGQGHENEDEDEHGRGQGEQSGIEVLRGQVANLVRERRPEDAAELQHQILALDPTDRDAFNALDSHYRRTRDHERRLRLLVESGMNPTLPDKTRVLRLREAASLAETRLRDVNAAVKMWRQVMRLEPDQDEPKRNLKRLLERGKRWDDLLESLRQDADAAEGKDRVEILKRMAGIHRNQRKDELAALPLMAEIVEIDPDDAATRDALCETLLGQKRYDEAVPLLQARVEQAGSRSQRLPLLRKLADAYDALQDIDGAFETYQRIFELSPKDVAALSRMESLDETAGNFERLIESLKSHRKLVTPTEAAALSMRMAQLAEQELLDRELAIAFATEALDQTPTDAEVLGALCDLFERAERYDDLVELLQHRAGESKKATERMALLRRAAILLGETMGQPARAAEAWRAVVKLGDDLQGLHFLADHARRHDGHAELADILERLAGLSTDRERTVELLLERGRLLVGPIDKPARAIADLSRILEELDPECDAALDALQQAATAAGRFEELATALQARLERSETDDTRRVYAERLADLFEGPLPDPKRAQAALLEWTRADATDVVPHRRLRPLLSTRGHHDDLLKTLDALSALEDAATDRHGATIAAAELLAGPMKDPDAAWERLSPLVALAVPDVDATLLSLSRRAQRMDRLHDAYEGAGRFDDLLRMLHDQLEAEQDDAARAKLLGRIAILNIEQLDDPSAAEAAYDSLLELTEDADALRFIQAAAVARDDPERLADVLQRLAALEPEPAEQRHLLLERANLLHARLGRADEAVALLQELLERFGEDAADLGEELLEACEAAGDYAAMAAHLETRLGRETVPDARIGLARRLADLYDHELDDAPRAIAALRHWTAADPEDPDPLRRLRHRLEQQQPGPELLHVLDALADKELEREAQLRAQVAAAELCAGALGKPDEAWERLVRLIPEAFEPADRSLRALAARLSRTPNYHDLLEEHERYEDLAALLEKEIEATADRDARIALQRRLGRLLSAKLGDLDAAAAHFVAILELVEDGEALRFMHARALHADDPEALADALGRLAQIEQDPRERRDLHFEHAHVLGGRLSRRGEAIDVLMRLLQELDPEFDAAIEELIALAEVEGDDAHLAEGLSRMLAREADSQERALLAQRLYALRAGPLGEPQGAAEALRAWVQAAPEDPTPHRHLLPLLRTADDAGALLASLDALTAHSPDPGEQRDARVEAAGLCDTQLQDADGAWTRLAPLVAGGDPEAERMLQALAERGDRMDALCTLYEQAQRFDDLVRLLGQCAEQAQDKELKADLYARCARVLGGPLGDDMAAAEAWQDVLEFREDREALHYLRGFYQRMDDVEQLADVLGRLSNQLTEPAQQRELLFERALLLSDRLERPGEAISVLRYIVSELDPAFAAAIEELIVVCEGEGDHEGLADGLSRQLALQGTGPGAAETARRLANLYEQELEDSERLRETLFRWALADPDDPAPHQRLRPLLDPERDAAALQTTLDAIATLDPDPEARREAARRCAELTYTTLKDAAGAWKRLAPLVHAGDADSEALAMTLAKEAGYAAQLASIYVMRAQKARDPEAGADNWARAARVYDEQLDEPAEALEAALRMFATDTTRETYLEEVERLAVKARAWPRLGQVYARLQKQTIDPEAQLALLVRQGKLLQERAGNIPGALKCVLDACKLAASDDKIYAWAEQLASQADGHAELQWIYERRAKSAGTPAERAQYLLRAARTADLHLHDREQAMVHLREALAMTEEAPEIGPALEDLARELDRARPELGKEDVRRGLVRAHLALAQQQGEPYGPVLVLRASQILRDELRDQAGCYDVLRKGATAFPGDADILDALHEAAVGIRRLDGLDAQLSRMAKDAGDPEIKLDLLLRRGDLLSQEMKRDDSAARVYQEILQLDPHYEGVAEALAQCLSRAGRFRELLSALGQQLEHTDDREERLSIMRHMAQVWESDLRNRPAAVGVWREILDYAPDDKDAAEALARLQA